MVDEAEWKRRFLIFMLVQIAGLAVFLLGIAIMYSDLLREGGWPQFGAAIALMGVIDAVFSPKLLKKIWEKE